MMNTPSNMLGRGRRSVRGVRASNRVRAAAAFSLIEILVSILILALGLLGLGAVFPVVIREQRQATDNVVSTIAANNVKAIIDVSLVRPARVTYSDVVNNRGQRVVTAEYSGLAMLLGGGVDPTVANPTTLRGFGLGRDFGYWSTTWGGWRTGRVAPEPDATRLSLGEIWFDPQLRTPSTELQDYETPIADANSSSGVSMQKRRIHNPIEPIGVLDRLLSTSGDMDETPTMVWDMVPRRVYKGAEDNSPQVNGRRPSINDDLQLAVFVRRVDPGIRVAPNASLRQAFAANDGPLPVGANAQKEATLDGTDGYGGRQYSWLMEATPRGGATNRDDQPMFTFADDQNLPNGTTLAEWSQWLENVDVGTPAGAAMAQVGQKLIDNLGNVYSVERVEEAQLPNSVQGAKRIRLSPAPSLENVRLVNQQRKIKQFIFTPQVPLAVFVVDVPVKREILQ